MNDEIRQAIYDKYIAPTKKERPDYIGVEIEMPVVNLSGQPVDEAVSIEAAERFVKQFNFIESGSDTDGNLTSAKDTQTEDILSFDCCYSNLSKRKLPEYIDEGAVEQQLIHILDLASAGLQQRELGEEALLAPLYERVYRHTNTARTMLEGIKNGIPLINYIEQYAAIQQKSQILLMRYLAFVMH